LLLIVQQNAEKTLLLHPAQRKTAALRRELPAKQKSPPLGGSACQKSPQDC
jgi:hypothetical protein